MQLLKHNPTLTCTQFFIEYIILNLHSLHTWSYGWSYEDLFGLKQFPYFDDDFQGGYISINCCVLLSISWHDQITSKVEILSSGPLGSDGAFFIKRRERKLKKEAVCFDLIDNQKICLTINQGSTNYKDLTKSSPYVLLKKDAVRFDLIEDFEFERHIKVIYKVKISVCFYEKALKNRTISRYDRTI